MKSGQDILIRFIENHASWIDEWGSLTIIGGFLLTVFLIFLFINIIKTGWLRISVVSFVLVFLTFLTFTTFIYDASLRSFIHSLSIVKSAVGEKPPDMEFIDASDMQLHKVSEFSGEVIILFFEQEGCELCAKEWHVLDSLGEIEKGKFKIIALANNPQNLIGKSGPYHSAHILAGTCAGKPWLDIGDYTPFTIILDKKGKVRQYFYGWDNFDFIATAVHKYLIE